MGRTTRLALLLGPAVAIVGFFLVTMAMVLSESFRDAEGGWSLALYIKFLGDPYYLAYLGRSAWIATYATAIALVLGWAVAYSMARGSGRFAVIATLTLAIQFFSVYVIKMYGWMIVLGRNGVVNRSLVALGLVDQPLRLMYNELGVAIGLVASSLPLMVFPINAALQGVSTRLEEAATGLGATRAQVFLRVTLPLSAPGVVAGIILTFVFNFTAYLTPALLGGGFFKMIGNLIYDESLGYSNVPFAAAAALVTLAVSFAVITGANLFTQRMLRGRR